MVCASIEHSRMKINPNSKGMFLALSLFLLVFLLTVLRPDQLHVPIVEIDDTANGNLELVLSQQPSRSGVFLLYLKKLPKASIKPVLVVK